MSLKPLFLFACTVCALPLMAQKNYTLTSPDGTLQATVATGSDLRISLSALLTLYHELNIHLIIPH